jgi:hypothetical protein
MRQGPSVIPPAAVCSALSSPVGCTQPARLCLIPLTAPTQSCTEHNTQCAASQCTVERAFLLRKQSTGLVTPAAPAGNAAQHNAAYSSVSTNSGRGLAVGSYKHTPA